MNEYQEFLAMQTKVFELSNEYEQKAYQIAIIISDGYIPRANDYSVDFGTEMIYFQWKISYRGEETDVGNEITFAPDWFDKSLEELKTLAEQLVEELRKREFEQAQLAKKNADELEYQLYQELKAKYELPVGT